MMRVLLMVPPPSSSRVLPAGPMSAVVATVTDSVLPETTLLLMVSGLLPTSMAGSMPSGSPRSPLAVTELCVIAVLSTVVGTPSPTWIPPPFALRSMSFPAAKLGRSVVRLALLRLTVLFLTATALLPPKSGLAQTAPPSANRPFGAAAMARLPDRAVPVKVRLPCSLKIPPPSQSLQIAGSPPTGPAVLSLTVVFTSVSSPQLSMPPPTAAANGHWPSGNPPGRLMPEGTAADGSAMFPLIALSEIVTVAPLTGGPSAGRAFGGISTPPPAAHTPSFPQTGTDIGLDRARPPVIVTPLIDTTGSPEAPKAPIVS